MAWMVFGELRWTYTEEKIILIITEDQLLLLLLILHYAVKEYDSVALTVGCCTAVELINIVLD